MKTRIYAAAAFLTISLQANAVTLVTGTLADYLALGPGGGTIGSTLFSNFSLLPNQTGATAISPSSIGVVPINLLGTPTLQFDFSRTALAGQLFEMRIGYNVSGSSITGAGVGMSFASATGDAAVTALLLVNGPVPPPPALIAFESLGFSMPTDFTTFAPTGFLAVESDVVVDGGLAGQGRLGRVTNQFNVVRASNPVPDSGTSLLLLATALSGIAIVRRLLVG